MRRMGVFAIGPAQSNAKSESQMSKPERSPKSETQNSSEVKVLAQRDLVRQTSDMRQLPGFVLLFAALCCGAQTNDVEPRLRSIEEGLGQVEAKLSRQMNEMMWFQLL